ncbi:hypothetical protein HK101_008816 [Irineochytrium annulatum]|nr:hypothetical protein HK101_008816 [Irineochytrium annulatum]
MYNQPLPNPQQILQQIHGMPASGQPRHPQQPMYAQQQQPSSPITMHGQTGAQMVYPAAGGMQAMPYPTFATPPPVGFLHQGQLGSPTHQHAPTLSFPTSAAASYAGPLPQAPRRSAEEVHRDVRVLLSSMHEHNCAEESLVNLLSSRSRQDLADICAAYSDATGGLDLARELRARTFEDFGALCGAMCENTEGAWMCLCLSSATEGIVVDRGAVIDTLIGRERWELDECARAGGLGFWTKVAGRVGGLLGEMVQVMVDTPMADDVPVEKSLVLFREFARNPKPSALRVKEFFIYISSRPHSHLSAVIAAFYQTEGNRRYSDALEKHSFNSDAKKLICKTMLWMEDPYGYVAGEFNDCLHGAAMFSLTMDLGKVVRLVERHRDRVFMEKVKQCFRERNKGEDLVTRVSKKLKKGSFKDLVMALIEIPP